MTYEETLQYLYTSVPVFQHSGPSAYKPGLGTSMALDKYFNNPHTHYRTIHVGGTNGKGSVSHLLAAVLQRSGYKVGLYTSPHLVDFRERIRVNGEKISEEYVIRFVEENRSFFEPLHPSFFELTSAMALAYFQEENVDFAVIEVGLGGRLDSTNIISPILSIITNISLDHTQFLGDTVEQIASEKAGIIKEGVPAILGEKGSDSVYQVFADKANEMHAPLFVASEQQLFAAPECRTDEGYWLYNTLEYGTLIGELGGEAQVHNTATVLTALKVLQDKAQLSLPMQAIQEAFRQVTTLTGLMGRWQTLHTRPTVICDTGHNVGGWQYIADQLRKALDRYKRVWMVVGMVNDKDVDGVLSLMPQEADYLFTQASIQRAMPAKELAAKGQQRGLSGQSYPSVPEAVQTALAQASTDDLIFIGGSTFIVADALPLFSTEKC